MSAGNSGRPGGGIYNPGQGSPVDRATLESRAGESAAPDRQTLESRVEELEREVAALKLTWMAIEAKLAKNG